MQENHRLFMFYKKGEFVPDMIPTVGFNMHKVDKGKVSIKVWDLGGQKKFRGMWERYCRKNDAIVFMIDAADPNNFPNAKKRIAFIITITKFGKYTLIVVVQ